MPVIGDRSVLVINDDRMLNHQPDIQDPFLPGRLDRRVREILNGLAVQWKYPEHPGRITAIIERLNADPIPGVRFASAKPATMEELGRVHTSAHLREIERMRGKHAWLDVDTTAVSPGSIEAAEVAAGAAIGAVDAVCKGQAQSAFALCRPPGHHAEPARSRGFCFFNNVAVAATHAQQELGMERVLIVDWDAHHGNGTQDIFWASPNVMLFDTHRSAPFYPGSGLLEDVGAGLGEGTTINVPLPGGAGDQAMLTAFRDILVPATKWFQPDLMLISAGFDAHRLDLCLNVSYEGFAAMTAIVQSLADQHCEGRLALVLEGGYHLESLSRGVHSVLQVLAGGSAPNPEQIGLAEVAVASDFHRTAFTLDPSPSCHDDSSNHLTE
ncbi:histone deacetylase family protein [Onishia niordana]|uniref:histone deacetylase family protein n=1 Tax=Onishia niordana TaxID=2508711 RepID=UPI0010A0B26F|nr:histone deacetylase [Halomonas niordiana]